ncbi:hypothetical protein OBBRIDRAFT_803301 [Obba rivulosa]|uniref:Uncharacterized protein n=1 Tax=Obba rivulosa TaxID=1052685 RepID=A0A8E2B3A3_9APHY|nr:hypothetical protein OBBRIDRAFT_803301 [Obba rivulosa]
MTTTRASPMQYMCLRVPVFLQNCTDEDSAPLKSSELISRPASPMTDPYISSFIIPFEILLRRRRFERLNAKPRAHRKTSTYFRYATGSIYTRKIMEAQAWSARFLLPSRTGSWMFGIGISSPDITLPWHNFGDRVLGDWEKVRQAFCIAIFAAPGTLRAEYFKVSPEDFSTHLPEHVNRMMDDLRELAFAHNAPLGLLTDETIMVVIKVQYSRFLDKSDIIYCEAVPVEKHPVRFLLASEQEFKLFQQWKSAVVDQAQARPVLPGDILTLARSKEFSTLYFTMRSPIPKLELPSESLAVVTRWSRPRDLRVDNILVFDTDSFAGCNFSFLVTDIGRSDNDAFSQLFFETMEGSTTKLCLKLYDERRFPLSGMYDFETIVRAQPWFRLDGLEYGVEIARREEATYTRLSNLQGSLMPHYYGIYTACILSSYPGL